MYKIGDWVIWVGKGGQRPINHTDSDSQMKAQITGIEVVTVRGVEMLNLGMTFPNLNDFATFYLEDKVIPFMSPTPDWEV